MLFKGEHRIMICEGTKTETRRPITVPKSRTDQTRTQAARRPARPGAVRGFYTRSARFGGLPFCRAEILTVEQERLGDIDDASARAEGYASRYLFERVWCQIWGEGGWRRDVDSKVWVVKFGDVVQLRCAYCGGDGMREFNRKPAQICDPCIELLDFAA